MTGKTTINWNSWEFSLIASMVDDLNVWGSKILGRGQGKGSQMRSWLNSTIHIRISYPIQLGKIWMDDDKKASSFCSVPKSCFSFWYNVEIYFVCVFLLPWQNPQKTVSNTFFDTKIKTLAVGEIHFPSEFFSALPYNGCQFVIEIDRCTWEAHHLPPTKFDPARAHILQLSCFQLLLSNFLSGGI